MFQVISPMNVENDILFYFTIARLFSNCKDNGYITSGRTSGQLLLRNIYVYVRRGKTHAVLRKCQNGGLQAT